MYLSYTSCTMMLMKRLTADNKGFSVIEILIVIIILVGIGAAGYFVVKHHDKTSKQPSTTVNTKTPPKSTPVTPTTTPGIFTATITADECATSTLPIGDVGCSITVNGNITIDVVHGNTVQTQPWGTLINFPDYPNNPTGKAVTVYAKQITATHYTLEGLAGYYVKITN